MEARLHAIEYNPARPVPKNMLGELRRIKDAKTWVLAHDIPEDYSADDMSLLANIIQVGAPPVSCYEEVEQEYLSQENVDVAAYWIWCQCVRGDAFVFNALITHLGDLRHVFLDPSKGHVFQQLAVYMLQDVREQVLAFTLSDMP
jgi:hypothetical protein